MPSDEMLVVYPAELFEGLGTLISYDRLLSAIKGHDPVFMPREEAENDPRYKQLVTYCLLWDGGKVFSYQRTKGSGENRLHGKYSIGIGGHVEYKDWVDGGPAQFNIHRSMVRELSEEVEVKPFGSIESLPVGVINDNSDPVGKVHLGIVYDGFIQSTSKPILRFMRFSPLEDSMDNVEMLAVSDLVDRVDEYESWSQIIIQQMGYHEKKQQG